MVAQSRAKTVTVRLGSRLEYLRVLAFATVPRLFPETRDVMLADAMRRATPCRVPRRKRVAIVGD